MNAKFVGSVLKVVSIAAVPFAALSIAAPAGAQGNGSRELFDWRGNVDQEIRVQMQDGRTSVIGMGPREMTGYDNARAVAGVPATNGYVTVQMRQGRGSADVVQQPSAQNGYTTIVRIRDTQGGAGSYDVAAFWQPAGNYGYGNSSYGTYGTYGRYGNAGQYGTYQRPVIVQQPVRPVYRSGSVYGNRSAVAGKTLPVPPRVIVNPSRAPQYPARVYGNQQVGKTLPSANQSSQSGKTLPGTVQHGTAYPRGH